MSYPYTWYRLSCSACVAYPPLREGKLRQGLYLDTLHGVRRRTSVEQVQETVLAWREERVQRKIRKQS